MNGATALNLRHLRTFSKVAELKSIRRAAEVVCLSQPAITQAIAKLEAHIGVTLFERCSNGTFPNEAGRILQLRTDLMFRQIEEALVDFGVPVSDGQTLESVMLRLTRPQIRVLSMLTGKWSLAIAARKLDISAVSLHRSARDLKRTLGKPLFESTKFGIDVTPAASELARKMALAMREIEWAIDEIASAEGRLLGELRIGAMPLAGGVLLGCALNDVTTEFPDIHTHVASGNGHFLSHALRVGEIDFIVGGSPSSLDPDEVESETLMTSPFVLVGRRGHPLCSQGSISLSDLQDYEWITPSPGTIRWGAFASLFSSMSHPPKNQIESNVLSTLRILLSGSDRLTLLTRFEFQYEAGLGALDMLPFPVGENELSIGVVWRRGWVPTPLHQRFLDRLRTHADQIRRAELQPDSKRQASPRLVPGGLSA